MKILKLNFRERSQSREVSLCFFLGQSFPIFWWVCFFFVFLSQSDWTLNMSSAYLVCFFFLQCLKQYVELLIKEGLETAISCPDSACPKRGHLQENEVLITTKCPFFNFGLPFKFNLQRMPCPCPLWQPCLRLELTAPWQSVNDHFVDLEWAGMCPFNTFWQLYY